MAVEMRKTRVLMDKPILVGQAILNKSKELMYEFFYDYLKPKYPNKIKLCYMDTDSFILDIKTDDFSEDTKEDLEKWFDTSNYYKDMILPEEYAKNAIVNNKVIGKIENELGKGHMGKFLALSPEVYAYQHVNVDKTLSEDKRARGTSKAVTKKTLSFDHYKKCLFNNETVKSIQHKIKSTPYSIDTVQINRVALKNNDNKRLRSYNGVTTLRYGTSAFKVCSEELMVKLNAN